MDDLIEYTGVPVSVLVPLPGPYLYDSLSVRLDIRTFDPNDLGIRTCTDTGVPWNLACYPYSKNVTHYPYFWSRGSRYPYFSADTEVGKIKNI